MKLTVQIKLLPSAAQAEALRETLQSANRAADRLSQLAWERKEFRQFPLHRLAYKQIRSEFHLVSQLVIRLIAKVADAYKLDRNTKREFRPLGSISYDCRILSFNMVASTVSIWAIVRQTIPFVCGERQRKLLELAKGESDLIFRKGKWFLNVTVDVPEARESEAVDWIGIDLGLVNLARSSDGQTFGDARKVSGIRNRRFRQRKRLQSKGTKSAKRVLRRLSGREQGFMRDVNHVIAKQISVVAERTKRGVALEELTGVRARIRVRKAQRRILHSWAFADLRKKIAYKCRLVGVPVKLVDPRNSSRQCAACGHIDKKNRRTRDTFACQSCGFTTDADTNGAVNLRGRAIGAGAIIRPHAGVISYANEHGRIHSQASGL